jgi:hypothetical protein
MQCCRHTCVDGCANPRAAEHAASLLNMRGRGLTERLTGGGLSLSRAAAPVDGLPAAHMQGCLVCCSTAVTARMRRTGCACGAVARQTPLYV